MKVVLVIERGALLLWGQIMNRDEGAKRSHPKWKNHWKNILKEKDLRVVTVTLRMIEALINKEVSHRKGDQKSRGNDIDLKVRKTKRKSIRDTHPRHHHKTHLMMILMGVIIERIAARKVQIPNLKWFLRRISTNTAYP